VSNPWSPVHANTALESFPSSLLYNNFLTKRLKRLILSNRGVIPEELLDWEHVTAVRNIREFDQAVVVPMFGYTDLEAYYRGK
jgi:predicted alpha/beta-fold hydrolase